MGEGHIIAQIAKDNKQGRIMTISNEVEDKDSPLYWLKIEFDDFEKLMDGELVSTDNNWREAFLSRLTTITNNLYAAQREGLVSNDAYGQAKAITDELAKKYQRKIDFRSLEQGNEKDEQELTDQEKKAAILELKSIKDIIF